jgi:transposase
MGKSCKTYEVKFKQNIVKLYESGTPVQKLKTQYNISEAVIYNWIKLYGVKLIVKDKNSKVEAKISQSDIDAMQRKIDELTEDNEVLKKAMTIFAQK